MRPVVAIGCTVACCVSIPGAEALPGPSGWGWVRADLIALQWFWIQGRSLPGSGLMAAQQVRTGGNHVAGGLFRPWVASPQELSRRALPLARKRA